MDILETIEPINYSNEKESYGIDYVDYDNKYLGGQRWNTNVYLILGGTFIFGIFYSMLTYILYPSQVHALGLVKAISSSFPFNIVPVIFCILLAPLYARLSDLYNKWAMLGLALVFFTIGKISIGSYGLVDIEVFQVGYVFDRIGDTGRDLLLPIILAETLIPENRALGYMLYWLPNIATVFIEPTKIEPGKVSQLFWMYILLGVGTLLFATPILFGLYRQSKGQIQRRYKLGWSIFKDLDVVGLILLTSSLGLMYLCLKGVISGPTGFANQLVIYLHVAGVIGLILLLGWELKFATYPLLPRRILQNKNLILLIAVKAILKFQSTINWIYFTYLITLTDINESEAISLNRIFQISWYFTGFVSAVLMKKFKWSRSLIWLGCFLNIVGLTMTIPARNFDSSGIFLIAAGALISAGSGFATCVVVAMYQSLVDFKDIATITYIALLCDSLICNLAETIATSAFNGTKSETFLYYLPSKYAEKIPFFLDDLFLFRELPMNTKDYWVNNLGDTQLVMSSISVTIACFGLIISLFLNALNLD